MKNFVRQVRALLDNNESVALATIVGHSGSTPRSSGAKMALPRSGGLLGTVGGGVVEAEAMQQARALLDPESGAEPGTALVMDMDLTSDLAAGTDMICGGRMSLLLERLDPGSQGHQAWIGLDQALRSSEGAVLVTRFSQVDSKKLRADSHVLIQAGETPPDELAGTVGTALDQNAAALSQDDGLVLAEPFVPPAPVYLFGAGHVSRATARLAAFAGFGVVVVDDRADFANKERFPDADRILVPESFDNAVAEADVIGSGFVVILTRGHAHDKTVLGQALRVPARYVGMIGSRKKREAIYTALRKEGCSEADIARCHCPIGLSIGAQTPEEIALSIVGELVAVRAGERE